jgi:hypothetical protein
MGLFLRRYQQKAGAWRSVKYEAVSLKVYEPVSHARRSIGDYLSL